MTFVQREVEGVSMQEVSRFTKLMPLYAFVLVLLVFAAIAPAGTAVAVSESESGGITNNITDTENLLGNNIGDVTDAIAEVKDKTGVTLNLLYLPTFDGDEKPATWAAQHLESLDPPKNTVMLAVASEDGNLAVVVSKNSDHWLSSQETVDALSQAAVGPIVSSGTPDWSGSAIALAKQIETEKTDADSAPARILSIVLLALVAVLAVALAVFFVRQYLKHRALRRRHAKASHGKGKAGMLTQLTKRRGEREKNDTDADAEAEADTEAPRPEPSNDDSDSDSSDRGTSEVYSDSESATDALGETDDSQGDEETLE